MGEKRRTLVVHSKIARVSSSVVKQLVLTSSNDTQKRMFKKDGDPDRDREPLKVLPRFLRWLVGAVAVFVIFWAYPRTQKRQGPKQRSATAAAIF